MFADDIVIWSENRMQVEERKEEMKRGGGMHWTVVERYLDFIILMWENAAPYFSSLE